MRKEFEKLPEIAEIIKEGVFWDGEIYRRTAICKLTHLYYVRGAWYAWQAKAQAVQEQVLDTPACVGGGTFQKGVKWSTVIGAAQRHYENDGHHEAPAICIKDQLRVASGHSVVVPKEPTYEMIEAGSEARSRTDGHIASIWEAMIEAQEQNQ